MATGVDAVHAGFLVTMVQVHGKDGFREDLVGGTNDAFQHQLVGVAACPLADLDDERGLAGDVAPEEAHALLEVVDVVGTDGVLAVSGLEQILRRDDHCCFLCPFSELLLFPERGNLSLLRNSIRRR